MRAHLAAREPSVTLNLMEECDQMLLEPKIQDQTHNVRNMFPVLVYITVTLKTFCYTDFNYGGLLVTSI